MLQYDSHQLLGPLALTLAIVPGENPDEDDEDKANAYGVSAAYSVQGNTFKAQYIDSDRSIARSDASQFSLGIDHMLGKRSLLYGYYTRRGADEKDQCNRYVAIGIKHPF